MTAADMAYASLEYVQEISPIILIIGAISIGDLMIMFIIKLFSKLPKFKW